MRNQRSKVDRITGITTNPGQKQAHPQLHQIGTSKIGPRRRRCHAAWRCLTLSSVPLLLKPHSAVPLD
jgi:hypothetical protein